MLRTVSFADLQAGIWGVIFSPVSDQALIVVEAGGRSLVQSTQLAGSVEGEDWTVSSQELELRARATGGSPRVELGEGGLEQLCQVHGSAAVEGETWAIDCAGGRGRRDEALEPQRIDSVRSVSAQFGSGEGISLLSMRPRGAAGNDADVLSVALFRAGAPVDVFDPRLSTTYRGDGRPARANLELWVGEEEGEQYPHRASGQAVGPPVEAVHDGFFLQASPFSWQSAGRAGAGVYVLARPA